MSDLIVLGFETEDRAREVRDELLELQREYLIDLEDAAVVVRNEKGRVKIDQAVSLTGVGALSGGFWGLLVGLIFLNPLLGAAVGAAAGAATGALTDIGVDDDMIRQIGETLQPGSSAIFLLVRKSTPDKVLPELAKYDPTVIQTSLTMDDEAELMRALMEKEEQIAPAQPDASGDFDETPPEAQQK